MADRLAVVDTGGAVAEAEQRRAILAALERKVTWLSTWMIHHANHVRPNRDGLKVGGHQASSASLATLMTALYFDVLRPHDRVAVKPQSAAGAPAEFPCAGRGAVLSVAHQGRRRRRLLHRLGRAGRGDDQLRRADPGLCPAEGPQRW